MSDSYRRFVSAWSFPEDTLPVPMESLVRAEKVARIQFPSVYIDAMTLHGPCSARIELLDLITDNNLNLRDVSDFINPDEIAETMRGWDEAGLPEGLVPFAKDCMGNLFCFAATEASAERQGDSPVYFWDHDYHEVEQETDSFVLWLERFNALAPKN